MSKYNFADGDFAAFNHGGVAGYGIVIGVATTEVPILGCYYMINVATSNQNLPNDTYPFKAISIPEIGMVKLKLGSEGYHKQPYEKGDVYTTEIKVGDHVVLLIKSDYLYSLSAMPEPEKSIHVKQWAVELMSTNLFPSKVQPEHLHQFLRYITRCK